MKMLGLIITIVIVCAGMPATLASDFDISVEVITASKGESSQGAGGFLVNQHEYGRVGLAFPENLNDFDISSSGTMQVPISRLDSGNDKHSQAKSAPFLMADIYLKPSLSRNGNTHLDCFVSKFVKNSGKDSQLYSFSESTFDIELSNNEPYDYKLFSDQAGDSIILRFSAEKMGGMDYVSKDVSNIWLTEEYSLVNLKTGKIEAHGKCSLGFGGEADGVGNCWQQLIVPLPEGDTLLYIALSEVKNIRFASQNKVTFDFEVWHIYALNPKDYNNKADDLKSENMSVQILSKEITIDLNRQTEIEIPVDSNQVLPFEAKEIFILTSDTAHR